jgi:predicted ATPase
MAEAVSFTFGSEGTPQEQILAFFRDKKLLLVLDNFEHLVAGAPLLIKMIANSPGVKLLSTSRARLKLHDEQIFEVGGMRIPEDEAEIVFEEVEAVELFIDYARRTRPDYALKEEDKPAVVQICRLVAGMPLGLQLAAAWIHTLQPHAIVEELALDIDFLTSSLQDVPERQRSMRAVFEHSWKLLPEQLREIFRYCSVFRGGFTREAAKKVAGASARALSTLVEQSMLQRAPDGRFHVHELMRQFAAANLAEDDGRETEIRDRHWDHYSELLSRLDKLVTSDKSDVRSALSAYQDEYENIQTAWEWATTQERFEGMKETTMAIYWCPNWIGWDRDGYQMCLKGIRALEDSGLPARDRSLQLLLWRLAVAAGGLGELSGMESRIDRQAQYLAMLEKILAQEAISDMGYWFARLVDRIPPSYWETATQTQLELYDLAIKTFRKQGRRYEVSEALRSKAWYFNNVLKRKGEALTFFKESLAVAEQAGSYAAQVSSDMALSSIWYQMGDYREAYRLNHQLVSENRSWLDAKPSYLVILESFSAQCLAHLGEYGRAKQLMNDILADSQESGNQNQRASGLMTLFEVNVMAGDLPAARQNLEAYRKMYPTYGDDPLLLSQYHRAQGMLAFREGEHASAQSHFEDALAQYERHSGSEDSVGAASLLSLLSEVLQATGQRERAWDTLGKAVRQNLSYTFIRYSMNALLGLARWLRDAGDLEEAVEVAALVAATRGTSHFDQERTQALLDEIEPLLPHDTFAAARERGQRLTPEAVYVRYWGERSGGGARV